MAAGSRVDRKNDMTAVAAGDPSILPASGPGRGPLAGRMGPGGQGGPLDLPEPLEQLDLPT
jgi:hypothetical protein